MRSIALTALVALVAASCAPAPRTQLMIVVDAEPTIRVDARSVRVEVYGGPSAGSLSLKHMQDISAPEWPLRVAVIPSERDATRIARVVVTARGARTGTGEPPVLAVVRADSGFIAGRTLEIRRMIEERCRAVVCMDNETCSESRCASSALDPGLLPEYGVDAATPPLDAPPDAYVAPDAWSLPVRAEGEGCDIAGEMDSCATGSACTCTGALGCQGSAEPPRCWAFSDIHCGRPIDLSERVARSPQVEVSGDGAEAPDLVPGACRAAAGELVYLLRSPGGEINVSASTLNGMEFWYSCDTSLRWGSCTGSWSFSVGPTTPAYIMVEGSGTHRMRIDRHTP